jgi:hypothetical protein
MCNCNADSVQLLPVQYDMQHCNVKEYQHQLWLRCIPMRMTSQTEKAAIEGQTSLEFAGVFGLTDRYGVDRAHPACPQSFVQELQQVRRAIRNCTLYVSPELGHVIIMLL